MDGIGLKGIDSSYVVFAIIKPILRLQELTEKISGMDFTESEVQRKLSKRKDEIGLMWLAV